MANKQYEVPNISCMHCRRAIESALGGMAGVEKVEVNVEDKTVDVSYDENAVTPESLEERLAEEGYPVKK